MNRCGLQSMGFFANFSKRLVGWVGADSLQPSIRARLLTDKIQAMIRLTPTLSAGAAMVALLLVVLARSTPAFPSMAVWAGLICATLYLSLRRWYATRNQPSKRVASSRAMSRAALHALVAGSLWGALPFLIFPLENEGLKFAAGLSIASVLCAATLSLSVMPVAAISFALPVFAGVLGSLVFLASPEQAKVIVTLMVAFGLTIPLIGLSMARNFVQHLLSEERLRQQKDIISLLLNEFEEHSSDWLWEFNDDGCMQHVSDRFAAATGRSAEELMGEDFVGFLRGSSSENSDVLADMLMAIATRSTFHDVVVKLELAAGERWWRALVPVEEGEPRTA